MRTFDFIFPYEAMAPDIENFRPKIFRPKKIFFQSFQMVQFAKLSGQNRNLKTFSVFSSLRGHPCSTLRKFIQVKQVRYVKGDEQVGQFWQFMKSVLKLRPSRLRRYSSQLLVELKSENVSSSSSSSYKNLKNGSNDFSDFLHEVRHR